MKTKHSITQTAYATLTVAALAATAPQSALSDGWAPFHPPGPAVYGAWQLALNLETAYGADPDLNTPDAEFCPAVSRDGRTLYFVSDRSGGLGGTDIWVSRRGSVHEPWGKPENLRAPINTSWNELCPTPFRSRGLLFVSNKPDGCGGTDIYFTWADRLSRWAEPLHLGCEINSPADEMGPMILEYYDPWRARWSMTMELYFSSNRAGGFAPEPPGQPADGDIYYATFRRDGSLGPPQLVPGMNTVNEDQRPNLRADGLEMFFDSNRPEGFGILDIWSSTRRSVRHEWSAPVNLGMNVNTDSGESRPSLSGDGTRLYIASIRSGGAGKADLYVATREKLYWHR